MSRQLITEYRSELDRIHAASGSKRESVVREAFKDLLKRWGKSRDLIFLAEHEYIPAAGNRCYIDGALVHSIRVPFGYWEAKDTDDDLDEEIRNKTAKGYPRDNIIYEDTDTAVLIQNKREVARVPMEDAERLFHLLESFFAYERPEIADFRKAVAQFKADLPAVLERLREIIAEKRAQSRDFARAELAFLDHAREAINPAVSEEDVQEMLIQHVLTEDIFAKVFDNPEFHRKNNVAAELYKLEEKLFSYPEKQGLLRALRPYYAGIESTAALIESHSEKQQFLKGLYENFYKVYNPLAADRLGVVYTPGEIVRFMIRSADWLCHKHFGKGLDDRGVEILDPATGTGTFIVELLEHFRGNRDKLAYKYREELHANEVAILPYYVANLNIEATYHAITGQFAEFPGLVFVDTLDNVDALGIYSGHQHDLLGAIADENAERIKRQNRRKISVIIGNPPYNANQQNENQNNKNRAYSRVDERIKQTYIKASNAQKTKLYDMYVRFFRWASDRLSDEGIVAFITNRSFIDASMADGFRRKVADDFAEGWIVDLGGDYKKPGVGGSGNVFGIGTGVAVSFWIKRKGAKARAKLFYLPAPTGTADDKLSWIGDLRASAAQWNHLNDRDDAAWIDLPEAETADLLPLVDKATKLKEGRRQDRAIFKLFSLGVATNRDEWVYDADALNLAKKIRYFVGTFNNEHRRWRREGQPRATGSWVDRSIKWTSELEKYLRQPQHLKSHRKFKRTSLYRPFNKLFTHFAPVISHRPYQMHRFFPFGTEVANQYLAMTGPGSQKPWMTLASDTLPDLHLVGAGAGTNVTPRYRYTKSGERIDNITDWALNKFKERYKKEVAEARFNERVGNGGVSGTITDPDGTVHHLNIAPAPCAWPNVNGVPAITKDAIFAYCYAVLHDPMYREKYALNLKREFPRIPFYDDFAKWAGWGQRLLDLHIGYEKAEPFAFTRVDTPNSKRAKGSHPKPKLKSEPDKGLIVVDEDTQITGIPREAWDYRLGNRSAIDWVLDQHKEKTPRDPTVREKFNTYRFADYKESMIDLLARVVTVSLETVKITDAMRNLVREGAGDVR